MKNFMQCCYTRVGGQTVGSGWQAVAFSENLPLDVQKNYGTLQNAHVPTVTPVDETGEPLNLFDISVIGDCLYLTRIQYGLLDELNRQNNMFAHTFIFSMKGDDLIKNPNIFLTVRDDNFKSTQEEAENIPEELNRREDFTLEEALNICSLDQQGYETLIQCVYAQIYANKGKKPLYISGVDDAEQVRALLYCIYKGIPYSMRRSLSCATANVNDALKKNIIISNKRGASELFLDIKTGSNNILTQRVVSRFARYEYVTAFPRKWKQPVMEKFFDALEAMAVRLGNPAASDATILKLAYQMLRQPDLDAMVEEYSEDDLHEKIYEALTARSEKSAFMDEYIAKMLSKISGEGYLLREEEDDVLTEKLGVTESEVLQQAGEQYKIHYLSQMEPEKAARKMAAMNGKMFVTYSRKLAQMPTGNHIMDIYYSKYKLEQERYVQGECSWEDLNQVLRETEYLESKPLTMDALEQSAWSLYTRLLDEAVNCQQAYNGYEAFMYEISPQETMGRVCLSAKETYWEHVTMMNFSMEHEAEYRFFQIPNSEKTEFVNDLMYIIFDASARGFSERLLILTAKLASGHRSMFDENGKKRMVELLAEANEKTGKPCTKSQREWYEIALHLMDAGMMEQAIRMSRELCGNTGENFREGYQSLQKDILTSNRKLKEVSEMLNERLICMAERWDAKSEDNEVLLDNWLLLGKYKYENPFQILDEVQMNVLDDETEEICGQSQLLYEDEYQEFAEEYMRDGGTGKQVKEWMTLIRKQQKAHKKQKTTEQTKRPEKMKNLDRPKVSGNQKDLERPMTEERAEEKQSSGVAGFMSKLVQKVGAGEQPEENSAKKKKKGFWDRR